MISGLRRAAAVAVLLAVPVLASCGNSEEHSYSGSVSTTVDVFASADAVAAAFANAYAGGDTPTACTFTSGAALERLNGKGLCTTRANWTQIPRLTKQCTDPDGSVHFAYDVDSEVDRNLQFEVYAGRAEDNRWTVTQVIPVQSGTRLPLCSESAGSATSSTAG